jgi:hypothetical protein
MIWLVIYVLAPNMFLCVHYYFAFSVYFFAEQRAFSSVGLNREWKRAWTERSAGLFLSQISASGVVSCSENRG